MSKLTVLLDVDGVLANPAPAADTFLGEWRAPEIWDFCKPETPKEIVSSWWNHFGLPGFCYNLPMYPGAQEFVETLWSRYDVHVVTSPFKCVTWVTEREMWLKDHFGFERNDITHTVQKHRIRGDVLIDDKWSNHGGQPVRLMPDHPYNTGRNTIESGIERVNGYSHTLARLKWAEKRGQKFA